MSTVAQVQTKPRVPFRTRVEAHFAIARFDHITKNVFVLPGLLVPLSIHPELFSSALALKLLFGMAAITLVACSNYVINEVLDAPFDRFHPSKHTRPVPSGLINVRLAYVQWAAMMLAGVAIGLAISNLFTITLAVLWLMGCLYNIPPIRTKDKPYLDVTSESINNPLRMLLGWYIVSDTLTPPISLLTAYWMVGCYFMAIKRFSEYRQIDDPVRAAAYRRSFAHYTETSLLVSILFYASTAMLFFGAFTIRYRLELALSFPFVAVVMAIYFHLAYQKDSVVQNPEKLHKNPALMGAVALCALMMIGLLFVNIPVLEQMFVPSLPT